MAGKFKVVVSDLHLGAGFAQEGNALEDFTKDAEFAGLLEALREESDAQGLECELIVFGRKGGRGALPLPLCFPPAPHLTC